jgi:hypothetical protein
MLFTVTGSGSPRRQPRAEGKKHEIGCSLDSVDRRRSAIVCDRGKL